VRPKYDANHFDVKGYYEQAGCRVADCAGAGGGVPDLFVACVGVTHAVEIKTADGRLEPSQVTFMATWSGQLRVVRTLEEVIAHVKEMRREGIDLSRKRMLGPERDHG
jgi:hypothetical protein